MHFSPIILQAAGGGGGMSFFIMMGLMILIFWFLVLRPQMKRQKQHMAMVNAVQRGDAVTTAGGIVGKVVRVQDQIVEIEISPGVKVQVIKQTLSAVDPKNKPAEKAVEKKKK